MRPNPLALATLASLAGAALACQGDPAPPSAAAAPKWQVVGADKPGAFLSVWGSSANDVWVVGARETAKGDPVVWRFDGKAWARVAVAAPGVDLWWVAGESPTTDVWLAGTGGTIARWKRATGAVEVMATPGKDNLFGILPVSSTEVWAVGGNAACQGAACSVVWRWDGSTWTSAGVPADLLGKASQWFKLWRHKGKLYVVGAWADDKTSGVALVWDGKAWTSVETGVSRTLLTIHCDDARADVPSCIAVGGSNTGDITELQPDGTWKKVVSATKFPMLNGVRIPAVGNPVAVGSGASVLERKAGKWVQRTDLPDIFEDFHSVWTAPDGAIWAAGGQILSAPQVAGQLVRFGSGQVPALP